MLVQDQGHRTGSPARKRSSASSSLPVPCSRWAAAISTVEEHALLGEAQRACPSPSATNSTVVSETEISRPSCQQVVGEDDPLVLDDVVEAAVERRRPPPRLTLAAADAEVQLPLGVVPAARVREPLAPQLRLARTR